MTYFQMLRLIASSNIIINDVSGFSFQKISGNIWSFHSLRGNGICWNDGSDRFKYSKCIMS